MNTNDNRPDAEPQGFAVLVKSDLPHFTGQAHLYRVTPPLEGHGHVVASATGATCSGPETYLFGADATGEVVDWSELPGSYRGGYDHEAALEGAGYRLMEPDIVDAEYTVTDAPLEIEGGGDR